MADCRICGRPLLDSDTHDLRSGDPRTDLGGDCLACVYATEKWMRMPRRLRCAKPVFADRDGERERTRADKPKRAGARERGEQ